MPLKLTGSAKESDVVLAFLKAEIYHPNHQQLIQQCLRALDVTTQDLFASVNRDSEYFDSVRAAVLDSFRGYLRRKALFTRFPTKVVWQRAELEPTDVFERLRYVRSGEWWPISDGTGKPQRVVDKIHHGDPLVSHLVPKVTAIQEKLKRGDVLPELVAVQGEGADLILIEGAHRTTAYVALRWPKNVPAFIGSSPLMSTWEFY